MNWNMSYLHVFANSTQLDLNRNTVSMCLELSLLDSFLHVVYELLQWSHDLKLSGSFFETVIEWTLLMLNKCFLFVD